jgi:charged multivesicular body protein 4
MSGWGWGNLFGGSAAAKKEAPKNAILRLRSTLEMLSKREKHLQNQMDEQDAVARKNVNTNKASQYHMIPYRNDLIRARDGGGPNTDVSTQSRKPPSEGRRPSNTSWSRRMRK